jgi:hypothetical protein
MVTYSTAVISIMDPFPPASLDVTPLLEQELVLHHLGVIRECKFVVENT